MFEQFTQRAEQVVVLAQQDARTLKHDHIGTQHILLGLLREAEGLAARVLAGLDLTVERVHAQVVQVMEPVEGTLAGEFPLTPRAQQVLWLARREALSLRRESIDNEHILLGLVREGEGETNAILLDAGADAEKIRTEVFRSLARS